MSSILSHGARSAALRSPSSLIGLNNNTVFESAFVRPLEVLEELRSSQ